MSSSGGSVVSYPDELQTDAAIRATRTAARITDDVLDFHWNRGGAEGIEKFIDDTLCRRYFELDRETISIAVYDALALIEDWKARAHEDEPDTEYGIVGFTAHEGSVTVPVAGGTVQLDCPSNAVSGRYTFDRVTKRIGVWVEVFVL